MGLQDFTYRLKAESGDSTPHDELAVSADLSGGTITLVDRGSGDWAWRFVGGATAAAVSRAVNAATAGGGVTIAFRMAVTNYGSTDFALLAGYIPSGQTAQGVNITRTTANIQRYRYDTSTTPTQTVNTGIRTIVVKAAITTGTDQLYVWLDTVGRSGTTPTTQFASAQSLTSRTLNELRIGSTGTTIEVSDMVVWAEELSDADCTALADNGIRTTLDSSDSTPPTLTSPTGTQTGSTTASGSVSTNEAGGTLYRLASTNSSESAATVKAAALTQAVAGSGVQNVTFTGLTPSTVYYAHYVHQDAAANDSAVASSASFTTAATDATAPTLTGSITVSDLADTSYTLTWPAGSDNVAVTGYEYRINGSAWTDAGNVLTDGVTGRTALGKDVVEVRAYDAAANVSSPAISVTVYLKSTGITGADLRTQTENGVDGAGLLFNDWDSGDDAAVFQYHLESEPADGTLTTYNNGSFTFEGAADGAYSFTYRLFVDDVDEGTATVTLTVGDVGPEPEPTPTTTGSAELAVLATGEAIALIATAGGMVGLRANGELLAPIGNGAALVRANGQLAARV